jgi:hypothetical protein
MDLEFFVWNDRHWSFDSWTPGLQVSAKGVTRDVFVCNAAENLLVLNRDPMRFWNLDAQSVPVAA